MLARCHDSVKAQTHASAHIVVADGFPHPIFENNPEVLHLKLPCACADNGNTPRALGSLFAEAQGFDAIAFLDADNWFEPDHLAKMIAAQNASGASVIGCKRRFFSLDEESLPIQEREEDLGLHVDTSCWLIFKPAFSLLRVWLMPKVLGPVCDRVFFQKLLIENIPYRLTPHRTVCFTTQYAYHYNLAGRPAPEGAKDAGEFTRAYDFLSSPEGQAQSEARLGFVPKIRAGPW